MAGSPVSGGLWLGASVPGPGSLQGGWVQTPSSTSWTHILGMGEKLLPKVSLTGGPGGHAPRAGIGVVNRTGTQPMSQDQSHGDPSHRSPPDLILWKTQCAPSILLAWLDAHPWDIAASTEWWHWSCAGLGAPSGQCGTGLWATECKLESAWFVMTGPASPALNGDDGIHQGERYWSARGEILRPSQDGLRRRRSAGLCSSIKDESLGNEDDQTPS